MKRPLVADPTRQASDSLAGYEYQLWHSLYSWLHLLPFEDLYLEGAEDIDRLGPTRSDTAQIKHVQRNLTLASAEAQETIAHFWENQQRNPERNVYLHLITTARVGLEQGQPFGIAGGIRAWETAKRAGTDLTALRSFLLNAKGLPTEVRAFVEAASDQELRDRLITRISWETESPSRPELRHVVEQDVVALAAEHSGASPAEARKVVPFLLDRVLANASARDRGPLTLPLLLEHLQEVLTECVPHSEMRRLRCLAAVADGAVGALRQSDTPVLQGPEHVLKRLDEKLATGFIPRGALLEDVAAGLARRGILLLKGSTGMGKSTLARLIAAKVAGHWARLDLRGSQPNEVRRLLDAAIVEVRATRGLAGLIVDDLNFDESPVVYENALTSLLRECSAAHVNTIVTGYLDFPARVLAELGLSEPDTAAVGPLTAEDIRQLVELHGCPSGPQVARWARIIEVATQGHPQLVHARALRLRYGGWPECDEAAWGALAAGSDLALVQRQARQRLVDEIPSAEARLLAYRLSVFTMYFRREHALRLASSATPGELFDRLLGPWVEGPTDGYYRLSPLLHGTATQVMDDDAVLRVRQQVCDAILGAKALGSVDFAEVVFQAFVARYDRALAWAGLLSERIPDKQVPTYFQGLRWFVRAQPQDGAILFPSNPETSLMLRDLQFRAALVTGSTAAPAIMDAWDHEFATLEPATTPIKAAVFRSHFLLRVLMSLAAPLEPPRALRFANELLELAASHPDTLPPSLRPSPTGHAPDFRAAVVDAVVLRFPGPGPVLALLRALEDLPEQSTAAVLAELVREPGHAVNLMLSLYEHLPPHLAIPTETYIATDAAVRLGANRGIPGLVAAAHRAQAILRLEYHNDSAGALERLAAGVTLVADHPLLEEYRARVLSAIGRHQEALAIWHRVLPAWTGTPWVRVYSIRQAAISASRAGQDAEAAGLFADSAALARELRATALATGLLAEQALALWRSAQRTAALNAFVGALSGLEGLPDPEADLESRSVHKLVGHAILWALADTPGSEFVGQSDLVEPPAGRVSHLPPDEEFRTLPLAPPAVAWGLLASLEIHTDAGHAIQELFHRRWPTPPVMAGFQVALASIRQRLRKRDVSGLVPLALQLFRQFSAADHEWLRKRQQDGRLNAASGPGQTDAEAGGQFVAGLLTVAAVICAPDTPLRDLPFERWQRDALACGVASGELARWLGEVTHLLEGQGLPQAANDLTVPTDVRLIAALQLLFRARHPDDLFLATATLVSGCDSSPWRRDMEGSLDTLVVRAWREVLDNQRFALRSPRTVAPTVNAACSDESCSGLTRCARVLLAALPGVGVRVSPQALAGFSRLAQGPPIKKATP